MTHKLKPCGTPAAYARHLYHGEEPCTPCRAAASEYTRSRLSNQVRSRARQRALSRLSRIYDETYARLLAEELAKEENR